MSLPQIGKPAPSFDAAGLLKSHLVDVCLSKYDDKYVVLAFIPMKSSYVCPTELTILSDNLNLFQNVNAEVIACSNETRFSHLKWLTMTYKDDGAHDLQIPVIADKSSVIAKLYGVFDEDQQTIQQACFIIDAKGILRHISVYHDPVVFNVAELCRLIKTIQVAVKLRELACRFRINDMFVTDLNIRHMVKYPDKKFIDSITE